MPAPAHPDNCTLDGCHECRERDHAAQVEHLVGKAQISTVEAIASAAQAARSLAELTGSQVYDIELTESSTGSDALADLAEASKLLRNVSRILDHRRSLLAEGH